MLARVREGVLPKNHDQCYQPRQVGVVGVNLWSRQYRGQGSILEVMKVVRVSAPTQTLELTRQPRSSLILAHYATLCKVWISSLHSPEAEHSAPNRLKSQESPSACWAQLYRLQIMLLLNRPSQPYLESYRIRKLFCLQTKLNHLSQLCQLQIPNQPIWRQSSAPKSLISWRVDHCHVSLKLPGSANNQVSHLNPTRWAGATTIQATIRLKHQQMPRLDAPLKYRNSRQQAPLQLTRSNCRIPG